MRILFVYQAPSSYVMRDLRILREAHEVRPFLFPPGIASARLLPALLNRVRQSDMVFSWFGSLHAFFSVWFARRLRKKSVVIAGGWDVCYAGDSMLSHWHKRWCPTYVFRHTDAALAVSDYAFQQAQANIKGIRNLSLVYHGFEADTMQPTPGISKEPAVLTAGGIARWYFFKRYDLILEAARLLPAVQFKIVGPWYDDTIHILRSKAPANLSFIPGVPFEKMGELYSQATVYLQPSDAETFGCAVAEAMLYECVPVVTRLGALPEVVGDAGVYTDLDAHSVAQAVSLALDSPELGRRARERIVGKFPYESRRDALLAVVSDLGSQRSS